MDSLCTYDLVLTYKEDGGRAEDEGVEAGCQEVQLLLDSWEWKTEAQEVFSLLGGFVLQYWLLEVPLAEGPQDRVQDPEEEVN